MQQRETDVRDKDHSTRSNHACSLQISKLTMEASGEFRNTGKQTDEDAERC